MKTLLILALCIVAILLNTILIIVIPHKIKNYGLSILFTVVGVILCFSFLLLIGLLGKFLGILEETKTYILIVFSISAFINTIYLYLVRSNWI